MNCLNAALVKKLNDKSVGVVDFIPEHGITTLMCSPTVSIPRDQLLKWEQGSSRHADIIVKGLNEGAKVFKTKFGGFIMK